MATSQAERLGEIITWDFVVEKQGFASRYGQHMGRFYKQHLPGGNLLPKRHPPRPITKEHYNLAKQHRTP